MDSERSNLLSRFLAPALCSSAGSPFLALLSFHHDKIVTQFSPFSNAIHHHVHLRTPPKHFSFCTFPISFFSSRSLGSTTDCYQPLSMRLLLQNKLSSPLLLGLLFTLYSHPSPLRDLTSDPFDALYTLTHSFYTQQRIPRLLTSCHLRKHACQFLPRASKQSRQFFSSILLIPLAYKTILKL